MTDPEIVQVNAERVANDIVEQKKHIHFISSDSNIYLLIRLLNESLLKYKLQQQQQSEPKNKNNKNNNNNDKDDGNGYENTHSDTQSNASEKNIT